MEQEALSVKHHLSAHLLTFVLAHMLMLILFPFSPGSPALGESVVYILFSDLSDTFDAQIRLNLEPLLEAEDWYPISLSASGSQWGEVDLAQTVASGVPAAVCIEVCEYQSVSAAKAVALPFESRKIPVIFFGRAIAPSLDDTRTFLSEHAICRYVNHDVYAIGTAQGTSIGQYLNAHYNACDLNGDGVISYVALQGDPSDPDAAARARTAVEAANEALSAAGHPALAWYDGSGLVALADPQCTWSADFARNTLSTILKTHGPDSGQMIELVICGNDDMANGAVNALFHVGYNTDEDGSPAIPVYGVDGTLLAQELIRKGRMTGTVVRNPEAIAQTVCEALKKLKDTEAFHVSDRLFSVPYRVLDASQMDDGTS
mgnify:FL=1